MIRGFFSARRRPYVVARFKFAHLQYRQHGLETPLLVDTGADRTILSPAEAGLFRRLGIDITTLPIGPPSIGLGGSVRTRILDTEVTFASGSTPPIPISVGVVEPVKPPAPAVVIPSIMGRDILSRFALFFEERTNRVLLLDPAEADALTL